MILAVDGFTMPLELPRFETGKADFKASSITNRLKLKGIFELAWR